MLCGLGSLPSLMEPSIVTGAPRLADFQFITVGIQHLSPRLNLPIAPPRPSPLSLEFALAPV